MKQVYAPGCALKLYKPGLAEKTIRFLQQNDSVTEHLLCCRHDPKLEKGMQVINTCPGCDRRYRELYDGLSTVSLWEVLAESQTFPFPDYGGEEMAVHDSCPTRTEERVHSAVRVLLKRMNIKVFEPENTRTGATCCGDSFYGSLPTEQVRARMRARAGEMPRENVAVYCLGCVRSMAIGGKKPRYILDLLFNEETDPEMLLPESWHGRLQQYISEH